MVGGAGVVKGLNSPHHPEGEVTGHIPRGPWGVTVIPRKMAGGNLRQRDRSQYRHRSQVSGGGGGGAVGVTSTGTKGTTGENFFLAT